MVNLKIENQQEEKIYFKSLINNLISQEHIVLFFKTNNHLWRMTLNDLVG